MHFKEDKSHQTLTGWLWRFVLLACAVPVAFACTSLPNAQQDYAVGQVVEVDEWRLTLHSLVFLPGDQWRQPDPGQTFCAVEVTLENLSRRIRYFMPERQMVMLDGTGREYTMDHRAGVVSARTRGWNAPEGAFNPEASAHGAVAYELPVEVQDLRWVFRSNLLPWAEQVGFWLGSCPAEP